MTSQREVDLANAMLQALTKHGPRMSNPALGQAVGLEYGSETYHAARDVLLHQRLISLGPGQGGTVRLADQSSVSDEDAHQLGDPCYPTEESLYAPMSAVIERDWSRGRGALQVATQVTAHAGQKDTGGAWSRPDITTVELRTFTYVPGRYLDVVSFEVKPVTTITVQGVYEALAHRHRANRSYLLIHVPLKDTFATEQGLDRVSAVAREQGVGLIVAADPSDFTTWTERVPAERSRADPVDIDRFIATQLHPEQRDKVADAVSSKT